MIENADVCILLIDATRGDREPGSEYLLLDTEEPKRLGGLRQQMGYGGREGPNSN